MLGRKASSPLYSESLKNASPNPSYIINRIKIKIFMLQTIFKTILIKYPVDSNNLRKYKNLNHIIKEAAA